MIMNIVLCLMNCKLYIHSIMQIY